MTIQTARFNCMSDLPESNKTAAAVRRPPSVVGACFRLALIMGAAYPVVAFVGEQVTGMPVWQTAAIACAVCWMSATLALVVFHFFQQSGNTVAGTLGATLVRIGIPMMVGIAAVSNGGKLRDEGVLGFLLVYYFVGLVADTVFSLKSVQAACVVRQGGGGRPHG
jgi:hypothetical protein